MVVLEKYKEDLNGYITDSFWKVDSSDVSSNEKLTKFIGEWNQFLQDYHGFYEDFSYSGIYPEMLASMKLTTPFVIVTPEYFKDIQLKEAASGETLKTSDYPNQNLILVTSSIKEDWKQNLLISELVKDDLKEVIIEDGVELMPHVIRPSEIPRLPIRNSLILIIQGEWPSNYGGNYPFLPYEGQKTETMIENFLKSIKTEGEARFTLNNTAWDLSKQTVLISLVEKTIILLIDMFLFASLVFVSIVLFFFNRQKENGVQILMRIPALTRWKIWILTWILMLVGAAVVSMVLTHSISLPLIISLFVLIVLSMIEAAVVIRTYEKGNEIRMLKGGEF